METADRGMRFVKEGSAPDGTRPKIPMEVHVIFDDGWAQPNMEKDQPGSQPKGSGTH